MSGNGQTTIAAYRPDQFEVASCEEAMQVIVTPEPGTTTAERWVKETAFLVEDIGRYLKPHPASTVLDYGCGIGRVAKGLIARYGCRVVGVDASKSMRLLAPDYVLSERFTAWSPPTLAALIARGFRADFAICIWVVQHVPAPSEVIGQIARSVRPGGLVYALNQAQRCVPTDQGWADDGYDVRAGLCQAFQEEHFHRLPKDVTTPELAGASMIQVLRVTEA